MIYYSRAQQLLNEELRKKDEIIAKLSIINFSSSTNACNE